MIGIGRYWRSITGRRNGGSFEGVHLPNPTLVTPDLFRGPLGRLPEPIGNQRVRPDGSRNKSGMTAW